MLGLHYATGHGPNITRHWRQAAANYLQQNVPFQKAKQLFYISPRSLSSWGDFNLRKVMLMFNFFSTSSSSSEGSISFFCQLGFSAVGAFLFCSAAMALTAHTNCQISLTCISNKPLLLLLFSLHRVYTGQDVWERRRMSLMKNVKVFSFFLVGMVTVLQDQPAIQTLLLTLLLPETFSPSCYSMICSPFWKLKSKVWFIDFTVCVFVIRMLCTETLHIESNVFLSFYSLP